MRKIMVKRALSFSPLHPMDLKVLHGALWNSYFCDSGTMFENCYQRISLTSITPGLKIKELNT
jgi:hypothetical protein